MSSLWLRSAAIEVAVRPERGAEIRTIRRPGERNSLADYEWRSPRTASSGATYGDDTLDWLSEYRGGWQELFPNAGAACVMNGVPLPFHGEASSATWEVLDHSAESVTLEAACRLPLVLTRQMRVDPDRSCLYVDEVVVNESADPQQAVWVHHPAFDLPDGSAIDLPGAQVHVDAAASAELEAGPTRPWPDAAAKGGGTIDLSRVPAGPVERLCYLTNLSEGWVAARCPDGLGIAMAWPLEVFPCLWLWQEIGGPGFPWYGRSAISALEPASAWPADGLAAAADRGQATPVPASGSIRSWLTVTLFDADERPVLGVERDGTVRR